MKDGYFAEKSILEALKKVNLLDSQTPLQYSKDTKAKRVELFVYLVINSASSTKSYPSYSSSIFKSHVIKTVMNACGLWRRWSRNPWKNPCLLTARMWSKFSLIHSFTYSLIDNSFTHLFIHLFTHSLIHSFNHSLIHSFTHHLTVSLEFIHSRSMCLKNEIETLKKELKHLEDLKKEGRLLFHRFRGRRKDHWRNGK